ncbi:MAG: hypothetical protein ACJAZP_003667 [Psychromonas sp.]|jgi:hypothetical protein
MNLRVCLSELNVNEKSGELITAEIILRNNYNK